MPDLPQPCLCQEHKYKGFEGTREVLEVLQHLNEAGFEEVCDVDVDVDDGFLGSMHYVCPVTMYLFVQQVFYYDYKYYVHRLYGKYDMYTLTSLKLTSMNQVPFIGVITL